MTKRKPEETPDARIERLRTQLEPEQYVKRLHGDLTAIVNELFYIDESLDAAVNDYETPQALIPTEHMTIVGFQFFNDDGERGGDVRMLFRDGSMPWWFARGLLEAAKSRVDKQDWALEYGDADQG